MYKPSLSLPHEENKSERVNRIYDVSNEVDTGHECDNN